MHSLAWQDRIRATHNQHLCRTVQCTIHCFCHIVAVTLSSSSLIACIAARQQGMRGGLERLGSNRNALAQMQALSENLNHHRATHGMSVTQQPQSEQKQPADLLTKLIMQSIAAIGLPNLVLNAFTCSALCALPVRSPVHPKLLTIIFPASCLEISSTP